VLSNLIKEKYKEIKNKYKFNAEKPESLFKYILDSNTDINLLTENVEINGTYSVPSLLFLKDNNKGEKPQNFIVEELKKRKDDLKYNKMEINDLSQWMAIGSQLSIVLPKIEESNLSEDDKEELLEKFTTIIETTLNKMTYTEVQLDGSVKQTEFNKATTNKNRIKKLIRYIEEFSNKEYNGKIQNIFNSNKVINNFLNLLSFVKSAYPNVLTNKREQIITKSLGKTTQYLIIQKLKEDKEILIKDMDDLLLTLKNIDKTQYLKLLNKYKEEDIIKQYIINNEEFLKKITGFIDDILVDNSEIIQLLTTVKKSLAKEIVQNIQNSFPTDKDSDEFKLEKVEGFSKKLVEEFDKIKPNHLEFIEIMEEVGEIPSSINEKEDIENIIDIFENFEEIFNIEFQAEDVKELFNSILLNSFKQGIITYEGFIEDLANNIEKMYQDKTISNKTLSSVMGQLKSNLTLQSNMDEDIPLSKKIINRAKEIKDEKNTSKSQKKTKQTKPKGDKK
jgi:hypothetical protein